MEGPSRDEPSPRGLLRAWAVLFKWEVILGYAPWGMILHLVMAFARKGTPSGNVAAAGALLAGFGLVLIAANLLVWRSGWPTRLGAVACLTSVALIPVIWMV